MGSYNKADGIYEVHLLGEKCIACNGEGIALVKEGDETKEIPCMSCESKGHTGTDKVLLRSHVSGWVKAEFEDWMENRARRRVFDLREKGNLNPLEYKDSLRAVADEVAAGSFCWGGDAWQSSFSQLPGQVQMYYLLMKDGDNLLAKRRQDHRPQKWNEGHFIQWVVNDPYMKVQLNQALESIMDDSPNFLSPPIRGVED